MFKFNKDQTAVIEQSTGTYIPLPAGGEAGARYEAWLSEGNTPEPADQPSHNDLIIQQIQALEATQTPRRIREGGQWLIDLDAQIAALREQLQ